MSIVLLVYLASVVDSLSKMLGLFAFLFAIAIGLYTAYQCIEERKTISTLGAKKWFVLIFFMFLTSVLLPSEKTIYIMAGASIAQDIANSPKTAATMDKVYKIIDSKLEEQLEAVSKEVSKKAEKKIEEAVK